MQEQSKLYEIVSEYHRLPRGLHLAVHHPKEKTRRSEIAVLATHGGTYIMSFEPLIELAKQGYTTAGFSQGTTGDYEGWALNIKAAVDYMRMYPGIKKVVLFGHSQGGCLTSMYQYLAENGTKRFMDTKRIVPFPELPALNPADGLMLIDANHGIMGFLGHDPAVKNFLDGRERIPELDLYNPENGYAPGCARYPREFADRFQKAQRKFYNDILAYAQQRLEDMRLGKGHFVDDDVVAIAGAGQSHDKNKLYIQDNRYLGHTAVPRPLLHPDGSVTNEIIYTQRDMHDAVHSEFYRGALVTTLQKIVAGELKIDGDYGYNETEIYGVDQNFNPLSTRANVKGIHVPLLCEGNQGNHEFVNISLTYDAAVSGDKDIIITAGADHGFEVMSRAEKYPGEFGYPPATFAAWAAKWLDKPGRFLD